jgi:hypothetical protein
MSRRRVARSSPFNLLPLVHEAIHSIARSEREKMLYAIQQFNQRMADAQKVLARTPGLDMTESEQLQRIANLEEAIRQKEELIAECSRRLESWQT